MPPGRDHPLIQAFEAATRDRRPRRDPPPGRGHAPCVQGAPRGERVPMMGRWSFASGAAPRQIAAAATSARITMRLATAGRGDCVDTAMLAQAMIADIAHFQLTIGHFPSAPCRPATGPSGPGNISGKRRVRTVACEPVIGVAPRAKRRCRYGPPRDEDNDHSDMIIVLVVFRHSDHNIVPPRRRLPARSTGERAEAHYRHPRALISITSPAP